jgi:HSP20 family protein
VQDYRKFLQEFEEFRLRARHLFEDRVSAVYGGGPTSTGEWTPAVDIYETADRIVLVAELAGVRREDVRLEVLGNVLTLSGSRPFGRPGLPTESHHRMEFAYGTFERSFALPYPVADAGVEAVLADGLLTVSLPRGDQPRERRIAVATVPDGE